MTKEEVRFFYESIKRHIHNTNYPTSNIKAEINCYAHSGGDFLTVSALKCKFFFHRTISRKHFPLTKYTDNWAKDKQPLVSVIVPNYNHAAFLRERIDCILNQTFQNFELILLDDKSQDESSTIMLSYKDDPKVSHIIINEENSGNTFLQWERGINVAKGKYIWIAESDDYADETFLERIMTAFYHHPEAVIARAGSYLVNERGRVIPRNWDNFTEDGTTRLFQGTDYISHFMFHFNSIYNASMVVFRKDAYLQISKDFQKFRYTGDWLCWMEILKLGNICEVRSKLNYFRQHTNKVSVKGAGNMGSFINELDLMRIALSTLNVSAYRKAMTRGEYYYRMQRMKQNGKAHDYDVRSTLKKHLGATPLDYRLFKLNMILSSFIPCLISEKNDVRRGQGAIFKRF